MGHGALLYNPGTSPAPYIVNAAFPDASSKVVELLMAMRSDEGRDGAKHLADLLNYTSWADLAASARGWTVAHSNNTSSVDDTANGSVGNAAKIDGASANVGAMLRRVRITRTTKLDSLRGWQSVSVRVRLTGGAHWEVQLRCGASLADPVPVTRPYVLHGTGLTPPSLVYVELPLGFFDLPEEPTVALPGVALEIWARRRDGAGDLFLDLSRHLPATPGKDLLTRITVPPGSSESWLGKDLTHPVTNPAGGTAGAISGDALLFDHTTDNAGAPPSTGQAWPAGRHKLVFDIENVHGLSSVSATIYARNITDNNDTASAGISSSVGERTTWPLEFDSVAGKSYQPQVRGPSVANALKIHSVRHEFIPYATQNEQFRGDPIRVAAEKLEADGDRLATLKPQGPVPFWIPPGLAAVFAVPFDVVKQNYTEPESVKARTLALSGKGAPRRPL